MIIGLIGKKRSGKDTVANYIREIDPSYSRLAFADELKKEIAAACNVSVAFIETNKSIFRPILQWWGTDFRRNLYGDDYWIKLIQDKINPCDNYIITDVRFPNEAKLVRDNNGTLVRIHRPSANINNWPSADNHPSEVALDNIVAQWYLNNSGTLEDLKSSVAVGFKLITNKITII